MPSKEPEVHQEVSNPGISYEPTQADLRVVMAFLVALGLASVMVMVVLWGMFGYFRKLSAQRGALTDPRLYTSAPKVPPPQLQPDPVAEFNVYRLTDQEILNSYGWVNQQAGITRIPIDRAMDLLVDRGLPWKAPGTGPAPTAPNSNPAGGPLPGTARAEEDVDKAK